MTMPQGPGVGAFFDLDGTLLSGYSAGSVYGERLRRGEIGPIELAGTLAVAFDAVLLGGDAARLGPIAVAAWRGRREDELAEMGERLFVQSIAGRIRAQARELVRAHRRKGHTVVIASAATRFQVDPVARDLGIEHVLCTEVETDAGILTGEISGDMLWGQAKAAAVRAFARDMGIDLRASHAYANGDEDIAFLSAVGNPHAVNPSPLLRRMATDQRWPVVTLDDPPRPGPRALLGTLAAFAGLNAAAAAGLVMRSISGDRGLGADVATAFGSDVALKLAGVRLNVLGEEHLWSSRPAVFLVNHQSSLDPIVAGALIRREVTAAGKKEARHDPRSMLFAQALDVVFIDRANPPLARQQLGTVVDRVRSGTSLLIAPEGTRTPTPTLAPFKKGAFHIAMQAGVPLVPIVLRNTGQLSRHGAKLIQPGTVDVCVLEPIPTGDWALDDLAERVAGVRNRYAETLEDWPA
jgi:putative phosphoserine phosphatase / 1-acylglycerol-3-phosphate O-acyltransferase